MRQDNSNEIYLDLDNTSEQNSEYSETEDKDYFPDSDEETNDETDEDTVEYTVDDEIKVILEQKNKGNSSVVFNIYKSDLSSLLEDLEEGIEEDLEEELLEEQELAEDVKEKLKMKERELKEYIKEYNPMNLTLKQRVLLTEFPISIKHQIIQKISSSSGEEANKNNTWVENVLQLPLGVYKNFPVNSNSSVKEISNFMKKVKNKLDEAVYGMDNVKQEILSFVSKKVISENTKGGILGLQGPKGTAKCLGKDTEIVMYSGKLKKVQNIKVGDILLGDDNLPRYVNGIAKGVDKMYKIKLENGIHYTCNKEHIMCLKHRRTGEIIEIPVKKFIKKSNYFRNNYHHYRNKIEYPELIMFESPYELGMNHIHNVPDIILYNSERIRLQYLLGIFCYSKKLEKINYITCKPTISLKRLIWSLGFSILEETDNYLKFSTDNNTMKFEIEFLGFDEYYGFTIDGNRRFLLSDYTVSHNTRIARKGIAEALDLPFHTINCGGLKDANLLLGHDQTYISAIYGRIAQILINSKCMNPIIYLDEIDKIGEDKATEIFGVLTHLLDEEQNTEFEDHYFKGIKLDLSKVLFILSFNHIENIDYIVADRMRIIKVNPLKTEEKVIIVKNIFLKEYNYNKDLLVDIEEENIKYIISKTIQEDGMRQLRENVKKIIERVNLCYFSNGDFLPELYNTIIQKSPKFYSKKGKEKTKSVSITKDIIDKLLTEKETEEPKYLFMYS
jgi:hypothetical protein